MRTLKAAARLLASATSLETLEPIVSALGFAESRALDEETRAALGLTPYARTAVSRGNGSLRALLVEIPCGSALRTGAGMSPPSPAAVRDIVSRIAQRLATRTPQLLWLILAVENGGSTLVVSTWRDGGGHIRLAALVADRARLVDSDAETICALTAATDAAASDVLTHERWMDVLGRGSLTRRFYRTLEQAIARMADSLSPMIARAERRELALLHASRLIFLSFLEAKGWLNDDRAFLVHTFDRAMLAGHSFHRHVLLPLFFGTLNTAPYARSRVALAFGRIPFLNGGLFSRTPLERRYRSASLSDEALGLLFGELLSRYRFTAREDRSSWSEAAIDPEMLGKAFESLMTADDRGATGAFYTPQSIVEHVTISALGGVLACGEVEPETVVAALRGEPCSDATFAALRARIDGVRLLDPACGSGAFLVHALEQLAALAARAGDQRPLCDIRRSVLTTSIFGVDVNPMAVWLCELRLWLCMVIESDTHESARVAPLPNLDHHIRVGDALQGGVHGVPCARATAMTRLRARYSRAIGARKRTLGALMNRQEREFAVAEVDRRIASACGERRDLLAAIRSRDLFGQRDTPSTALRSRLESARRRVRVARRDRLSLLHGGALPFSFATHFADVMARGGFDVVLGNPPWVRLHRIPASLRVSLRSQFSVFRDAAWHDGARAAAAASGFASQVDVAALFVERSIALLRPDGLLALLLPAKLWRSLAGGGVRALLQTTTRVLALEEWDSSDAVFDAATYPSLLVATRTSPRQPDDTREDAARGLWTLALHRRGDSTQWTVPAGSIPLDTSRGSPWLLLPWRVRRAFDCLTSSGVPLADTQLGRPRLGVKCGCNEAFLVTPTDETGLERSHDESLVLVQRGDRRGYVERVLLRPVLRGDAVRAWRALPHHEMLLWTHDTHGAPLRTIPPHALGWLSPWRRQLSRRADVRSRCASRWWSVFRTESAASRHARVVWCDIGRTPRALVLPPGDAHVPLNTCYVVPCAEPSDAYALATILNSSLAAAWLNVLAEPARGGYRRYFGWTMARLPVPRDWQSAAGPLSAIGMRCTAGEVLPADALDALVLAAYGIADADVAALVGWKGG